jgi:hypothetical protein
MDMLLSFYRSKNRRSPAVRTKEQSMIILITKRILILPVLILCSAAVADAEIYTWTDAQGVVTFTDNPARIPSGYISRAQKGEDTIIRIPKVRKEPGTRRNRLQAAIPRNRIKTLPAAVQPNPALPRMQPARKGHLGGDQTDPAPPSMKQPKPEPLGDQPTPTPPGMKQPKPEPLGDQPKPTPAGMKQPIPEPLGDQPRPTAIGMEQPVPKQ